MNITKVREGFYHHADFLSGTSFHHAIAACVHKKYNAGQAEEILRDECGHRRGKMYYWCRLALQMLLAFQSLYEDHAKLDAQLTESIAEQERLKSIVAEQRDTLARLRRHH